MGTNKRYAAAVDRRMDAKILERAAREGGPLQSLTAAELELDKVAVTIDPQPKPVRAWVRFGSTPVWVDAEACRWTPDAVAIRFPVGGVEHRAWVWASAVTPLSAKPPAG